MNLTKKVAAYVEQALKQNYRTHISMWDEQNPGVEPYTIAEWCDLESQSDPDFFRWLFNDPDISDFGGNLTDEERKIAFDFIESL
jgi:hypothetical protein